MSFWDNKSLETFPDNIHLVDNFTDILGENAVLPESTESRYEIATKELIAKAHKSRNSRGKFGGITLGSERFHQINSLWGGIDVGTHLIAADSNVGKCEGKNTPILMYDGSIKMIQDIVVGDLLMGPDSNLRTVLSTTRGYGDLHRVNMNKGNGSYIVNSHHILSLKIPKRKFNGHKYESWFMSEPFNISVLDYYKQNDTFKRNVKGYKVPINFPHKNVNLDPYLLGVWLGDGSSNTAEFTTMDEEIKDKIFTFAKNNNALVRRYTEKINNKAERLSIVGLKDSLGKKRFLNIFLKELQNYNLINNKHIPHNYLTNDRKTRLELLAGLIDTDGYYQGYRQDSNTYEIVQKSVRLANDIVYLCRSLGFHATVKAVQKTCVNNGKIGTYQKIYISGDLSEVPVILERKRFVKRNGTNLSKRVLNHSITVEPIGLGEYFGYELDQDGLYLMGDFTVTHNSSLLRMMAWEIVKNNPKAHVRFYTLDDSEEYFFDSFIAQAAKVPINSCHKPEAFIERPEGFWKKTDYERQVARGNEMYEKFLAGNYSKNFSFIGADTLESSSWERISLDIKQHKATLSDDMQLVVFIDNFHDIEVANSFGDQNSNTEQVAIAVDKLAKTEQLIIIGSAELKKNQQRRPILDDICGSRKWKYKARTVLLLYSEIGVGKPNPRLYFTRDDKPNEQASVLEIHFAKSKVSEFKGRIFAEQYTEMGYMKEVPLDKAKQYAMMIS